MAPMSRDPRIDAYIAEAAAFARPILESLREQVHAACTDVEESMKWSRPAFSYKGRPLAGLGAFTAHASFGLWHRQELATGRESEAMGQYGRLESLADLPDAEALRAQLRSAIALIDGGLPAKRKPAALKAEAEVPPALARALAGDAAASATFHAFPPGQRRDYCEWVADAKRPDTRDKRVAEAIGWLREGKRRNWKYESR
jgi:uncharacterized protein YdeI (YjbR/CyaY-like superfamily)